jgi:copper chaperone
VRKEPFASTGTSVKQMNVNISRRVNRLSGFQRRTIESMSEDKLELKVLGMACGGCKAAVEKALQSLNGVSSARVDLAEKTAYVEYDSGKLAPEDMKKVIIDAGYKVG